MSKSEHIRELGRQGRPVAEIAKQVGVSYQHARKVLLDAGMLRMKSRATSTTTPLPRKPPLTVDTLVAGGFVRAGEWTLSAVGELMLAEAAPKGRGVYAKVLGDRAMYVGRANSGLASRLYGYAKPGRDQQTNVRLNKLVKEHLGAGSLVDLYFAFPEDLNWNGLPVSGTTGLEQGLIDKFDLPWNILGS